MTNKVTRYGVKDRLILGEILKCVDGRWATKDGQELPLGTRLFVQGMERAMQCWKGEELLDQLVERPDTPLPDPEELNEKIPEAEWELGFDGKPQPPWALYYVTYLLDPATAGTYTHINKTTGARIAFDRLRGCIENGRMLYGDGVVPLIELATRPMKTAFGQKMRPEFPVVEWRSFGSGRRLPPPDGNGSAGAAEKLEKPKKPDGKPAAKNSLPGKPVKPIALKEQLDDDIPW
jgi:hypothetical protein